MTDESLLGQIIKTERNNVKKFAILFLALVAAFVGIGAILPALAKVRDLGAMPGAFVRSYTFGVFLLTSVGAGGVAYSIGRRRAR